MATRSSCACALASRRGCGKDTSKDAWIRRRPRRKHENAVGEMNRFLDVVRDQHDRVALLREDPQQLVAHSQAHQRVQRRERLVHIQNFRFHYECARQLGALQHAARQLVRIARLEALQADDLGVAVGDLGLFRGACPLRPNIRFSRTVSHGNTEPCCEIRIPRGSGLQRGTPSMTIAPASGLTKPAIMFMSVVLPQPEGPMMATDSPSRIVKLTSSITARRPWSDSKLLLRPRTSILLCIAPATPT